jgi:hypothetical protein
VVKGKPVGRGDRDHSSYQLLLTATGSTSEEAMQAGQKHPPILYFSTPSQAMPVLTIRHLKTNGPKFHWQPNPNRRITVSADMYVEDDETFGSNETVRRQKTNSAILSAMGIAQSVLDFEVRMGGEIRVEFTVTASLFDSRGNAMINGEVKLYEGTSESTGDLDGVRQFQLYIPAGATINHFVRVNNDDEGGDFATIALTVTNSGV